MQYMGGKRAIAKDTAGFLCDAVALAGAGNTVLLSEQTVPDGLPCRVLWTKALMRNVGRASLPRTDLLLLVLPS